MDQINHILFVSESEEIDKIALNQALEIAQSRDAKLTVVTCFDNLSSLSINQPSYKVLVRQMFNHRREELIKNIKNITKKEVNVKVFQGKPFLVIIREVIEFDVDLVIKPIESSGFKSIIFGSQDLKLLRLCPCPLWLIKPTQNIDKKHIIVAIDYEPENPENKLLNLQLLEMGIFLSLAQFAELHVVHTWQPNDDNFYMTPRLRRTSKEIDIIEKEEQEKRYSWLKDTVNASLNLEGKKSSNHLSPNLHLIKGSAAYDIPKLVKKIKPELLIMGTVGRTGIPGLFIGNTAEAILFDVDCSVLALKPEAFISPVKLEK